MSGGHFDYVQHRMTDASDSLIQVANDPERELPVDIRDSLIETARVMRIAAYRLHRADYLLSGDDGEDSYWERLSEDLAKLEGEQ